MLSTPKRHTVKPVYNDHLMVYFSAFWSSSRWPLAWYVAAIIDIYMTSPSVCLWKTVQHRQDYLSRWLMKFRTQYNTNTGPQTDDVWCTLWRQREREVVATDFLRRPYATPEWRWFWHASKIYGITAFMLNGLYRNMPVFLEDSFLILEHKVSFGFVPYPSSVLIYKNRPQGKPPSTGRLSCQWSVAQQRDSRPATALLAICAGNSPVTVEFPAQRPVTQSYDVFCDLRLNKRLRKQSHAPGKPWTFSPPPTSKETAS